MFAYLMTMPAFLVAAEVLMLNTIKLSGSR